MADPEIKTVPATVPWRSVIHLDIKDPELKKHVEGFLDKFEKSSYPYQRQDAQTGKITDEYLSGQDILARLKQTQDVYKQLGAQLSGPMRQALASQGMQYVDGKFTISDHNRPANSPANGSISMFLDAGGKIPAGIQIGTEYLKGATYKGVDGKQHPVTVDAVVAHELAHTAFKTRDEALPLQVEGIVAAAMGGEQRDPSTSIVGFKKDGNGGYQTLYDKQPEKRGSLEIQGTPLHHAAADTTVQDVQRFAATRKSNHSLG